MKSKFFAQLEEMIGRYDDEQYDIKIVPVCDNARFALVYSEESDDLMVFHENEEGAVRQMYFQTEVLEALRKIL